MAATAAPPTFLLLSHGFRQQPAKPASLLLHTPTPPPPPPPPRWRRRTTRCLSLDRTDDDLSAAAPPPAIAGRDLRVVLAAGGTGGHVYPAIAIADELKSADPTVRFLFVGSDFGTETTAVPSAGYDFVTIPTVRLARPVFLSPVNIVLPFRLLYAVLASWRILRDFRPDVVVGTGGYVSTPVCLAAPLVGARLVIQEQNSCPGIANRALTPFADAIFLAFPSSIRFFPKEKSFVTGNPVRLSLRRYVSKAVARSHFFPLAASKGAETTAQVVLVIGGSSGAYAINIALLNMYYEMLSEHKNRFIIWQTGEDGFSEMESLVKNHRRLLLTPFLHAMDLAYAAADVVVSRSGAMTCTEILTTGKPSILIPLPSATDDHQTKNAYIMADIAGSKLIMEDELDSSTLGNAIDEVLGDEHLRTEMSEKAMIAARPNASAEIAQKILSLVRSSTNKDVTNYKT